MVIPQTFSHHHIFQVQWLQGAESVVHFPAWQILDCFIRRTAVGLESTMYAWARLADIFWRNLCIIQYMLKQCVCVYIYIYSLSHIRLYVSIHVYIYMYNIYICIIYIYI